MIIAFLRDFKRKLLKEADLAILENVMLSEYLFRFLEFYGILFDVNRQEIDMNRGGVIQTKAKRGHLGFSVKYTDNQEVDIGQQAFKIRDVFSCFRNRFNFIKNYNFKPSESVLKYLINPSDHDFRKYFQSGN